MPQSLSATIVTLTTILFCASPATARPQYRCPRAAQPVTIDGDLAEWRDVPLLVLDDPSQVVMGNWGGPADCGARVFLQWDGQCLYLAAQVSDQTVTPSSNLSTMWMADSLQFVFDTAGNRGGWDGDDYRYQFGFVAEPQMFMELVVTGSDRPQPRLARNDPVSPRPHGLVDRAKVAARIAEGSYTVEAAIPWDELNPLMPIAPGRCGFGIIVNDNDGEGRKGWIGWTPGIGEDRGTDEFGDLVFVGDSTLELFAATDKLVYGDGEQAALRFATNSDRVVEAATLTWWIDSPDGRMPDGYAHTVRLQPGLNTVEASWPTGDHPRGTYTLNARLEPGGGTRTLSFVKESVASIHRGIESLRQQHRDLDSQLAEAEAAGVNVQYPRVTSAAVAIACEYAQYVAAEYGRKRPDVASRMLDQAGKLVARALTEVRQLAERPVLAPPVVAPLDLDRGITIRDGGFYNGEQPVILLGLMAAGRFEHHLQVIDWSPRLGFNFHNITEPMGPNRHLTHRGEVIAENGEWVRRMLDAAAANHLAVDLHLQDHYYHGIFSDEFPDVYDENRCPVGCHSTYAPRCLENANNREILRRYLEVLIPRIKDKPALLSYDLGNESKYACSCRARMELFRQWLRQRYGDLDGVNRVWGTKLASLEELPPAYAVDFPPHAYGPAVYSEFYREHAAARFDYATFNQQRFMDWFGFMRRTVQAIDEDALTWTKLMMIGVPYQEHQLCGVGIDREAMAGLTEINGMDGCFLGVYYPDLIGRRTERAYRNALFCDLLKSLAPDKPIMNGENLCADYNYSFVPPEAYRLALWESVIRGQAMTDIWIWSEALPHTPISQYASRPEMIDAVGRTSLDIRRLTPQIVPFWSSPRQAAVLYSQTSITWSNAAEGAMYDVYMAVNNLGAAIGFVTERQLAAGLSGDLKLIIVPRANYLPEAVCASLREFVSKGGSLLIVPPSLEADEHGRVREPDEFLALCRRPVVSGLSEPAAFGKGFVWVCGDDFADPRNEEHWDAVFARAGIERPVRLLDEGGEPASGIESRTVRIEGGLLAFVLNRTNTARRITIRTPRPIESVRDLIDRRKLAGDLELKPLDVMLLEITLR